MQRISKKNKTKNYSYENVQWELSFSFTPLILVKPPQIVPINLSLHKFSVVWIDWWHIYKTIHNKSIKKNKKGEAKKKICCFNLNTSQKKTKVLPTKTYNSCSKLHENAKESQCQQIFWQ